MDFLRKKFDEIRKPFNPGGKFEKFAPAINSIDTLLFVPKHNTHKGAHIRDGVDLKRVMITVIFALLPALLFGMYNLGYQHFSQLGESTAFIDCMIFGAWKFLPMLLVSYGVGLAIEIGFAVYNKHEVNEGYLVSGMLIPLIMPVDFPLWMLAISVIFAVFIGKEAFGGTGMNIFNPALIARAFAFFSYAPQMSGDKVWVADASTIDAVSGETILGKLAAGSDAGWSVLDMFLGYVPGSVGETSVLAILIGAAILIATGVGSWKIMTGVVVGGAAMGLIFNALGLNALMEFPWWQHLLVGGFAFGAVFMATDPVSGAQTEKGKWIYGILIGFFAIMIRVFNGAYPEGMMMAILLMNVFAPTVDHYVIAGNIKKRKKRLKAA
ncbi:NADH:ubiquinone reductase (Na(+)-transporting) subunit B [Wenyingzhuangia fucanilytica]|uniref:Na(+)-translocating NADH-quinone reductase subunit B n=1 Tax=Wenyingzhuangia fucanilytica TaxID=1790137 RepID=A0A1B1Y8A9_9FLAO|nr:NADH:ubiquinone reductase (Na(+)-transporting) subunit B [Wenyingzhuangia fucanilytica]ANW96959.1 NADH:ubiquinone reductase (Na(+)-transporting) subunit B [Wenyingzhuangia fucanilytica]